MMLLLLAVAVPACMGCHAAEAKSHSSTTMASALNPAAEVRLPPLKFTRDGKTWTVRNGVYSVSDGTNAIEATLGWVFGAGSMGRTFLYQRRGAWFESTVSYYTARQGLDFTPGAADRPRRNLEESLGRRVDPAEIRRCFGCHSTGGTTPVATGVQCSHCHEGSEKHASSLTKMAPLSKLGAEEVSNLCGKCHRTWEDITTNGPRGPVNVRFQPYRLASSRCYDVADRRIRCTACHDPHNDVNKNIGAYDAKCLACHATKKACPTAKENCAECHMPATSIPGIPFTFRDHWIRVVRPNERYPDMGNGR